MFNTFSETERLLLTAFELSDNSVKSIAAATDINSAALYKWKTQDSVHLSPQKSDALLLYFTENEPIVLIKAALVNTITDLLLEYSTSFTREEVPKEDENYGKC